ncbi:MAG: Cof-type HAD-IIB family hydrolase [Peptococcaceae bacterium]|nr:Cof-type HAD-IIB family hydrolase [Peptococcaceae bacterium]MDH7524758.1 Cof-type HAD-IIB family hydrolase [Peptococcaceae bacterium]
MPDIKLIAIDLDDTLLKNDLTISPRAKKAITRAVESGVAVTLATGRMFASALPFARDLNLDLPLITYQGALVKYADGRVVYHQPLPLGLAREVSRFLKPYGYHVNVYINDELYMEKDSPEGQRYAGIARVPVHLVEDLRAALTQDPTKMLVIVEEPEIDYLIADLKKEFAGTINITKSKSNFLEIGHKEATKGRALESLARSLGLAPSRVMAIGDSWNDIDMLEFAGLGVAVENAAPEVKRAARYITRSNDDDGVAEAIENLVLSGLKREL